MVVLIVLLFITAFCVVLAKGIEVLAQGSAYNVPPLRLLNTRWGVTTRDSGYTHQQGVYIFRGNLYGPSVFVKLNLTRSDVTAARLVAKYANDHGLRGLPNLDRSGAGSTPELVFEHVKTWHEAGGGKGGRVIEV